MLNATLSVLKLFLAISIIPKMLDREVMVLARPVGVPENKLKMCDDCHLLFEPKDLSPEPTTGGIALFYCRKCRPMKRIIGQDRFNEDGTLKVDFSRTSN